MKNKTLISRCKEKISRLSAKQDAEFEHMCNKLGANNLQKDFLFDHIYNQPSYISKTVQRMIEGDMSPFCERCQSGDQVAKLEDENHDWVYECQNPVCQTAMFRY